MPTRSRHLLLAVALVVGCAETTVPEPRPSGGSNAAAQSSGPPTSMGTSRAALSASADGTCDAGDEAWVRRATLHLLGRRPTSLAEVQVLVGAVQKTDRATVARALMSSPEFIRTWRDVLFDFLYVNRYGERANTSCSGASAIEEYQDEAAEPIDERLAAHIRDHGPGDAPFGGIWNLYDVGTSALLLDDLTPLLRVQLFAQLGSRVFDAENPMHELAWRRTYSQIFERAYLNRRMECLPCHNSAFSVTGDPDPALNRFWPAPGLVERAVYGKDEGRPVNDLDAYFRLGGVFAMSLVPEGVEGMPDVYWQREEGIRPWGIIHECGEFEARDAIVPDPLGLSGNFVDTHGDTASVWDLEQMLHEGFESLRASGISPDDAGELAGRDALAWMVSLSLAEHVWEQVAGTPLTAPHGFPRTKAQHDLLVLLAETFVTSGYSLQEVLVTALATPWFNPAAPADCDANAYSLPNALNPWVLEELDPDHHQNSAGDALVRVPPRVLVRSVAASLDWLTEDNFVPPEDGFDDEEALSEAFIGYSDWTAALETDIGVFVLDGEPGFRGSSFREAVAWEAAMGGCRDPIPELVRGDRKDWIQQVVDTAPEGLTIGHAVAALKNRLLADPDVSDADERGLLEALLEVSLDTPFATLDDPEAVLRMACTAFLTSPQFVLDGIPWPARLEAALPYPGPGSSRQEACARFAPLFDATCADGALQF